MIWGRVACGRTPVVSRHIPVCWISHVGRFFSEQFRKKHLCENSKRPYKNKKKGVVIFKIYRRKAILDVSLHPKRLNIPLKTLNESLEKSK